MRRRLLGRLDEALEQRQLLGFLGQRLRVPLHAEHELPVLVRILDRLDHPVRRPRDRAQAGAEPLDRLVVERVDPHRAAAGRLREAAVGRDLHLVRRAIAGL